MKIPKTPFSTRLSGSAKETELRLRSIFQWKKKRPPAVFVLLVAVVLLSICGGLVGFSDQQEVDEKHLASLEVPGAAIYAERNGLRSFEVFWQPDEGAPILFATVTRAKVSSVELTRNNGKLVVRYIDSYNDLLCVRVYALSANEAPEYLVSGASVPGTILPDEVPEIKEALGLADVPVEVPNASAKPLPDGSDVEQPTQYMSNGQLKNEVEVHTLDNLNLDGIGAEDDTVALTIYRDNDGPTGQVEVAAQLGSGETLTWDLSNEVSYYFLPELRFAYLTSVDRQSVVVKLNSIASTYGFAQYYVVEVVDGALVVTDVSAGRETLNDFSLVYHPVTGLAHIKIEGLDGEITLGYNNGVWSEVELDPMDAYERNKRRATIDGIERMPLDELPQEILDSLTLVNETDLSGNYPAEWGWYRTYTAPGLEITTSAPSAVYLEILEERERINGGVIPTGEDFYTYIEGEEDREWLLTVIITDDKFATLDGLKVGMTCTQAKELGYSLSEGQNYDGNVEDELYINVENGVVVQMRKVWLMGRYIGKFFEL